MKKIVILISGRGSNLEAILAAQQLRAWEAVIVQVICNRPNAQGIEIALKHHIPVTVIDHTSYLLRSLYDDEILKVTQSFSPDLIILAGYMRILSSDFIRAFAGRVVNIHPSLLPSFPGLNTHQAALQAGVLWHGATVHLVTDALDHGPIVAQGVVPVLPHDSPSTLADRVVAMEHHMYPQVIAWFINEQVIVEHGNVRVEPSQRQSFTLSDIP